MGSLPTTKLTPFKLVILLFCISIHHVSAETYYVTPTANTSFPEEGVPCMTLSQYAATSSGYFASDTSLILLPGNHSLDSSLTITSVTNLSILTNSSTNDSEAKVSCRQGAQFSFQHIDRIQVEGLTFDGCLTNIAYVDKFLLERSNKFESRLVLTAVNNASIVRSLFAVSTKESTVTHTGSHTGYTTSIGGSAVTAFDSDITVNNSVFHNNVAQGALAFQNGHATISNGLFVDNAGNQSSGAIQCSHNECHIYNCTFRNNTSIGQAGGAVSCDDCSVRIENSTFDKNKCTNQAGGAVAILCANSSECSGIIENSNFADNNSTLSGGAIAVFSASLKTGGYLHFDRNSADVVHIVNSDVSIDGISTFYNNFGSVCVYARNSHVTLTGHITMANNSYSPDQAVLFGNTGVFTFQQSEIVFGDGIINIWNNTIFDGAIFARETTINASGDLTIANNKALGSGGGIYMYQGELNIYGRVNIENNTAQGNGGGVYAIGTTITLFQSSLSLIGNNATRGGGIYLESNAKLYLNKQTPECQGEEFAELGCETNETKWLSLKFIHNTADLGGALYVDDDTTSSVCSATRSTMLTVAGECFLQIQYLYDIARVAERLPGFVAQLHLDNVHFFNNSARVAGDSLYGGLLDRCAVSRFAEVFVDFNAVQQTYLDGVTYLTGNLSNIQVQDISSQPVRVCFCRKNQLWPDCSYQPAPLNVRKGETFSISVVAVDQVNQTSVQSRIRSSVPLHTTLNQGQAIQPTDEGCTNLTYNVNSRSDSVTISMSAVGPCRNRGISTTPIRVEFLSCPIGFVDSTSGCDCDPILLESTYVTNCSIDARSVLKNSNSWVSYDNTSGQGEYLASPHCPFDYCNSSVREVNLNAADAQCAFNRSGRLCGRCDEGLSLLLGGSICGRCSNNGLALLIFFAIAGIALVAFILLCNLTVAVGTINGLIFYANIVTANRSTFFPQNTTPNVLTLFIAWLNLDFGFQTCFYDGMDGYGKTWLQLVFPAYIILLVVLIMLVSEYSQQFSKLLSNRNPVAALATLILLSYTKLLRLIIAGISFARIEHFSEDKPSETVVWRVDATLGYSEPRRIPLLIVSFLIAVGSLVFTLLLFCWQCLLRCPNRHPVKWVSNPRLKSFIDAYHAPYKDRHRYWLGLQLFARVVLYVIITAVNINDDPRVNLLTITLVVATLLLTTNLTGGGIYKWWPLNALENSFLFNLLIFATSTAFIREELEAQTYVRNDRRNSQVFYGSLAYTSTAVAFVTFLGILFYHTYKFILSNLASWHTLLSKIRNTLKKEPKTPRQDVVITNPQAEQLLYNGQEPRVVNYFTELREPLRSIDIIGPDSELQGYSQYQPETHEPPVRANTRKNTHRVTHAIVDGTSYCRQESLSNTLSDS